MARAIAPEQVLAEVERVMSKPFAWGACDCCSAACDVFARLWGVDPMASIRGYQGAMAAHRVMVRHGGLPALALTLAGRADLSPGHAVGGLALSDFAGWRQSLLICIQPGLWAGKSSRGFALVKSAARGWHLAQTAVDHHGPAGLLGR